MASKPGSPTPGGDRTALSTAEGSRGGKTPQPGAAAAAGGKKPVPPLSARGGGRGASGKPGGATAPEQKEDGAPSENELLRRLYSDQKEAERVRALEQSHETLLATCAELHRSLQSMDDKHTAMFLYKQRETAKQVEHQRELDATIAQMQQQHEATVAKHKAEVAALGTAHLAQVVALEERMAAIQAKYESLAQFQVEKNDLEAALHKYRSLLEQEKAHHALNVGELERRNVMEKDRLKNEMLRKIRETKLSLLSMTEDQLHTTTKRTIMENEQMTTELQYQSKETERIIKKNAKLQEENAKLRREAELAAGTQTIMAKKTMFFTTLIQKLQGKIDAMQQERDKERQMYAAALQQATAANGGAAAGGKHGNNTSINQILRGVDEMAALAGSGGPQQHAPILPRSIKGGDSRAASSLAGHSSSSSSMGMGSGSSGALGIAHPQGSQEDAATIARLSDRLTSLERDKAAWLDAHKQMSLQLREAHRLHERAEAQVQRLEEELNEARATIQRMRTHKALGGGPLGEEALQFIASCLEDQRLSLGGAAQAQAQARADEVAATLAPVVAAGNDATIVVRAPGEKPMQGGAAAILSSASGSATAGTSPTGDSGALVGWDFAAQGGYPSSLAGFSPAEKAAVLEHLFQQLSAFTRTAANATANANANAGANANANASGNATAAGLPPPHRTFHARSSSNASTTSNSSSVPVRREQQLEADEAQHAGEGQRPGSSREVADQQQAELRAASSHSNRSYSSARDGH